MAEQAQQEPTMEEILSSIRKIIADDDTSPQAAVSAEVVDIDDTEIQAFDDLDPTAETFVEDLPKTEDDILAAISGSDGDVFDPITDFDDLVDEPKLEEIEDSFEATDDLLESAPAAVLAPEIETLDDVSHLDDFAAAPEPEPKFVSQPVEEATMIATGPITDTKTVDAAAGSLGRLLSQVEFGEEAGGNNTIDGLVRELLRPMLKEWLDENLPAIVENAVELEVARIASKAR